MIVLLRKRRTNNLFRIFDLVYKTINKIMKKYVQLFIQFIKKLVSKYF